MKILWMTWKDRSHPLSGGAEVVNENLAKRLAQNGHDVLLLVGGFEGGARGEARDGYRIVRVGGRYSVYWHAFRYYRAHLKGWANVVIDEINTVPFFAKFYVREKNILFVHQLAREIWFYQMVFPLSVVGYLLEPLYLWLLSDRTVITVSKSSKQDLMHFGFKEENVHIISEGIEIELVQKIDEIQKYKQPTLLSLGAVRPMKRTLHILRAFEHAKRSIPDLHLVIAGDVSGSYGQRLVRLVERSPYRNDIELLGRVNQWRKIELMQKAHLLAVTSIKEGWGLVVTEANSQGTPAIVYDVDGLRDAVRHEETGVVVEKNTPKAFGEAVVSLLRDTDRYQKYREAAWKWSREITFRRSYRDFTEILYQV